MELKRIHKLENMVIIANINRTRMELKLHKYYGLVNWVCYINRTRMELKPVQCMYWSEFLHILIEPEWNWNVNDNSESVVFYNILIEPEWNWNQSNNDFNIGSILILIEPEWNWNSWGLCYTHQQCQDINRTRMELKQDDRIYDIKC